jgi:hypothetical protein
MSEDAEQSAAFRRRNRVLLLATTGVIAFIGLMIAASLFIVALRGSVMNDERLLRMAVSWLPAVFYVWVLWSIRDLFRALSRGEFGFAHMILALSQVGWGLMLGAATALIITPLLMMLNENERIRSAFALLNVPALTLVIVGLALIVLSHMMRRALALEAEAARLKATLEEFI